VGFLAGRWREGSNEVKKGIMYMTHLSQSAEDKSVIREPNPNITEMLGYS
jgi:hypothetical protein